MFTEKRIGSLIYDEGSGRMDIRFGLEEYHGGLHWEMVWRSCLMVNGFLHGLK